MYTLNKNNVALACLISCLLATPVVLMNSKKTTLASKSKLN